MSETSPMSPSGSGSQILLRLLLWAILILFAIWFLLPAYVVVGTSMKDLEEIRGGSLGLATRAEFFRLAPRLERGVYRGRVHGA